jgi:hypothetical protein
MQRLIRQVYLVEFYYLREIFYIHFTSPTRKLLATYISKYLSLKAEEVRSVCKYFALAGKRLDVVARKLGGFGALLLPYSIARTRYVEVFIYVSFPYFCRTPTLKSSRLERCIPLEGPEFDDVVYLLAEQGVHCNKGT